MSLHSAHESVRSVMDAYVNGTLEPASERVVAEHLATCPSCRLDEAAWRALAEAAVRKARSAPAAPPAPAFVDAVIAAAEAGTARAPNAVLSPATSLGHPRHIAAVLLAQLGVVRRSIWTTSALVFALGCLVAGTGAADAGVVLAVLAPLVAAAGVSLIIGSSIDPRLEVALSTATSPRLVLLARLALIFAFDLVLAVLASLLLVALRSGDIWDVVGAWLGPMLLLTSLSLSIAVVTRRPRFGITVGFGLWALRVLSMRAGMPLHTAPLAAFMTTFWSTTLPVIAVSGVLLLVTLMTAGREVHS